MAIETLETIKNWFRTSLKPTQQQFWDTWDSFRHKNENVPLKEVEGLDELLLTKANKDEFKTINGQTILGSGNLSITQDPSIPTLNQVLTSGNDAFDKTLSLWNGNDQVTGLAAGSVNYSAISSKRTSGLSFNELYFNDYNFRSLLNFGIDGDYMGRIGIKNLDAIEDEYSYYDKETSINLKLGDNKVTYTFNNINRPEGNYEVATINDIENNKAFPVSATESGIVNNDSLQELGGTDKLINGIRIGKGNANYENNLVIGRNGLASVTTGQYNVAIGNGDGEVEGPLQYLTTGKSNTMVGSDSGINNITGNYNTGVGTSSLFNNTTGSYNTGLGTRALYSNTTGLYNTAIGSWALTKNQFGSQNVAIGVNALRENVGVDGSNIFGHRSIAIGSSAMQSNTTGHGIAIGNFAMSNQTIGTHNVAIGLQAGSGITTGNGNVIVAGTGFIQAGGGITTGSNNMIIAPNNGNTTGITTGNGNVILGKVSGLNAALENNIVISNGVGNIKAQNDGTNWKFTGQLNKTALDTAPDSASAIGTVGEIRYTADYIYVCTAANKWVRSALTTW
ncbi:hypothetical protein [Flavobacterium hungaricum]|uniref:Trimeric autotransporter adhesin YadA-like head domain-containing protein n=1 Tax=Flavobacterium hungaricum TaxID=2082725 RepID=A0ABR9TKD2_9FLAO|nr:hypothetical protein [Flavobacterium hungaricum]MBE8725822.1 hypothetical protein [Flavobacterium hungaricum]